ncbi:MAG: glycosyltransferase family 2 protein [Proteobacteria bacterium]|nr:glycosyltransferase family 2 protein [Pseudomonadota bacterium]
MLEPIGLSLLSVSVFLILYHHVLYPFGLKAIACRIREHRSKSARRPLPTRLPSVEIVVPAHNEIAYIERKIENLAAIDYPAHLLRVTIALDGCTDGTVEAAKRAVETFDTQGFISLVEYTANVGKIEVLNRQIAQASGDIVTLSDASALFEPNLLLRAVTHFDDPAVGVVFPTYRLLQAGSEGERQYVAYQTQLKADESTIAAPMGGHGALYLFRRHLWQPMPADTINDDFILPMRIIADGHRGIYDTSLAAIELETTAPAQEFSRRVRIGAGNTQQALRLAKLAYPRNGLTALLFLSGKGSRPLMPLLFIVAGLATAALAYAGAWPYRVLLGLEIAALVAGVAGILLRRRAPKPLAALGYLVEGYAASLIGSIKYLSGVRIGRWQPRIEQDVQLITHKRPARVTSTAAR